MGKIIREIGLSSFGRMTSLGEGKTLNSKPEECSSGICDTLVHHSSVISLSKKCR